MTNNTHFFYISRKLSATISEKNTQKIFHSPAACLAQQHAETKTTTILSTDQKGSVFEGLNKNKTAHCYSPYGLPRNPPSYLGFNGELFQVQVEAYFLGNGYRTYSPSLMRFYSPDNLSPFGKGGLNTYSYCSNDPINYIDSSGQLRQAILDILSQYKLLKSPSNDSRYLRGLNGNPKKLTSDHRQTLTQETGIISEEISKLQQKTKNSDVQALKTQEAYFNKEIDSRNLKIKQINEQPGSSRSPKKQQQIKDLRNEQTPYRDKLGQVQTKLKPFEEIGKLSADLEKLNKYLRAITEN
ncbi:RHS repeat-associated core domain-containing protein [Pseudomonas sp. NPDC089422]|uniref:RHS repeat-associated core domain-containing protein n=1 Tax=Pseudomonas sp. NPDC089422 TaxID=3364466 RepID=UPI0038053819